MTLRDSGLYPGRLKAAIDRGKTRLPRVTAPVQVQDSPSDQSLVVFSRLSSIC
jgi:hypothetical protein